MISRKKALTLIEERCDFALKRHLMHVAVAMEAMATKLGYAADIDKWFIIGLLHDIDWNDTANNPSLHCAQPTADYLLENGVPEDWVLSIRSHCDWQNIKRNTDDKKSLAAVDELSGFCVAVALMRPTKMLGIKANSILKKIKDKHFARNVDRESMYLCKEYFSIELSSLLDDVLLPRFIDISPNWQLA